MAEFAGRPIEGWVELELLGHRVKYGHLTVELVRPVESSPTLFRLEVPAVPGAAASTHFYGPQAIYGIHPSTEAAVIDELTPWTECGIQFDTPRGLNTCILRSGHEGAHEQLPF